jgi:cell division protein FtsZ
MRIKFSEDFQEYPANIKIVGVGGGGGNAVNRMVQAGIKGVEFIAVNTDAQVLRHSYAHNKLQIGTQLTKGLGAGGKPEVGRKAAEEDREHIKSELQEADMVFVTAGMGGGTGTGAAPIIAEIARSLGMLTIGVVTYPFQFEGKIRLQQAEMGIKELRPHVDTLLIIPNDKVFAPDKREMPLNDAFRFVDSVLQQGIQAITDVITMRGVINIDFADVRTVMKDAGVALMGIGESEDPERRAAEAIKQAISSPLLDNEMGIEGAKGIIVNITSGNDFRTYELEEVASVIRDRARCDNVFYGQVLNEDMKGKVRITVIATGFEQKHPMATVAERTKRRKLDLKYEDITTKAATSESGSDDLSKPAYMRYKPRKLL